MPFKKGQSGNPQGRPKDSKNKVTIEIKELVIEFVQKNIESIQTDYDKLDSRDRLAFIEKLLRFIIPSKTDNEINVNALSDTELDRLCETLISKLNEN